MSDKDKTPLYVRLPEPQMKWIRDQSKEQQRTLKAIVSMMIECAQNGIVFKTENK